MFINLNGRLIEKPDKVAKLLIASGRAVQSDRPEDISKKEVETPKGGVKSPGRPKKK